MVQISQLTVGGQQSQEPLLSSWGFASKYEVLSSSSSRHWTLADMSAASTSTAVSQIELSVRSRQEGDTDLARIVEDADDILAASRLADSTVPDGGYGWVVIGGCGMVLSALFPSKV